MNTQLSLPTVKQTTSSKLCLACFRPITGEYITLPVVGRGSQGPAYNGFMHALCFINFQKAWANNNKHA